MLDIMRYRLAIHCINKGVEALDKCDLKSIRKSIKYYKRAAFIVPKNEETCDVVDRVMRRIQSFESQIKEES